jgi:flagellar basal-body rod protein FlgB
MDGRATDGPLDVSLIDPTQSALNSAIQGASMRHDLLAGNLANVNTPGYQRRDVDFHGALQQAMQTGRPQDVRFAATTEPGVVSADGNGVDMDRESAELAKNALDQQALVSVAQARLSTLITAITGQG